MGARGIIRNDEWDEVKTFPPAVCTPPPIPSFPRQGGRDMGGAPGFS
jgi:hypothetical protein